ncbi:hypothetical protein VIGAN_08332100, partial [Vigna angularis var. angularis]
NFGGWCWKREGGGCSNHGIVVEAVEEALVDDEGCNIVDDEDKVVGHDGRCSQHWWMMMKTKLSVMVEDVAMISMVVGVVYEGEGGG